MPFTAYFESECIPEWRQVYINYRGLRAMIANMDKLPLHPANRSNSTFSTFVPHSPIQAGGPERDQLQPSFINQVEDMGDGGEQGKDLDFESDLLTHGTSRERLFFHTLDEQLRRVSHFYNEREHEAKLKYTALKIQLALVDEYGNQIQQITDEEEAPTSTEGETRPLLQRGSLPWSASSAAAAGWFMPTWYRPPAPKIKTQIDFQVAQGRLKKAIAEYYRNLQFIKSFKDLNSVGAQRLVKKFDKATGWNASPYYMRKLKGYHWVQSEEVDRLVEKTEILYADEFTNGNRCKAERVLRIKKLPKDRASTCWRNGFYLGASLVLFGYTSLLIAKPETWERIPHLTTHLRIYASFSVPILFVLGVYFNMIIWTTFWINYKFIFELDPRSVIDHHQFAELPAFMLLLLALAMCLDFSQLLDPVIASEWYPMIWFITVISIFICPFNIMYRSARMWLSRSLGRVLMSYLYPVEFRDFYIADELNSLSYSLWTISYFFCAYSHRWTLLGTHCHVTHMWVTPFLAGLGPWWRFLQCIRRYQDSSEKVHLLNAIKYTTSIAATFATAIRRMKPGPFMDILWILVSMTNSSYTSIWDITQDWGLLQTASRNPLLRDDLVFPKWIYYVAAPSNVLLRFAWALNFGGLALDSDVLGYLAALMEAYRRIQWNTFRLENEHLNNCADHRAINEIPLPFSTVPADHITAQQPANSPVSPLSNLPPIPRGTAHLRLQRRNTCANAIDTNTLTQPGSFYGRRDFESKRELHRRKPKRRATDFPAGSPKSISSAGSSGSDDA